MSTQTETKQRTAGTTGSAPKHNLGECMEIARAATARAEGVQS